VVRYWLSEVLDDGSEYDGHGRLVLERLTLFYVDDGLLASQNTEWLNMAIEVLVAAFERVGLKTNTTKMKAMTCVPAYISNRVGSPAYKRRMDGTGESYGEKKRARASCPHCDKDLAVGSLSSHLRNVHGMSAFVSASTGSAQARQPASFRVSFPSGVRKIGCPIEGCPGTATSRDNLRSHFAYRHPDDTLCILEEGSVPYPKCGLCGMHVSPFAQAQGHRNTARCQSGAARRRQREAIQEARRAREVIFTIGGVPLESVSTFQYLGRPLSFTDDDWPALHRNLTRARQRWGAIRQVLAREDTNPRVSAMFYKAVVQVVLLYGCESWNITSAMLRVLRGFHHRVARRLTGMLPRQVGNRWVYPPIAEVLEAAGMHTVDHYIMVRQRTLIQNVATRPILELSGEIEWLSGSSSRQYWWNQQQVCDLLAGAGAEDDMSLD